MNSSVPTIDGQLRLRDIGLARLRRFCDAAGLPHRKAQEANEIFGIMSQGWGSVLAGRSAPWANDISDDGTPFEFSLALENAGPEVRLLLEPQTAPFDNASRWTAGLDVNDRLEAADYIDVTAFNRVADLFQPSGDGSEKFAIWHSAVVKSGEAPLIKVYLNPLVHGAANAPRVVEEALRRLGEGRAWDTISKHLTEGGALRYFSVDLSDRKQARAKVYIASRGDAAGLDPLFHRGRHGRLGDASEWLEALTGSQGPFVERPVLTCFGFSPSHPEPAVTLHVPVRCYVSDDAEVLDRVAGLLTPSDAALMRRVIVDIATRPLAAGRGLISYASLRRGPTGVRVTVYLAPELYGVAPPVPCEASRIHNSVPRLARAVGG